MGMRKGRRVVQASTPELSSKLADMQAQMAMAQRKANLAVSAGGGDFFTGFGTSQHFTPRPGPTMPTSPRRIALAPVNVKRNWGELLRNVPDGIYRLAQQATDGMTYAGDRSVLKWNDEDYEYEDGAGQQSADVHRFNMPEHVLRSKPDAIGRYIDERVGDRVTREAMDMIGPAPKGLGALDPNPVVAMLKHLMEEHAIYPAIHLSKRLGKSVSKSGEVAYTMGFAVAWVYVPELDEDDDED